MAKFVLKKGALEKIAKSPEVSAKVLGMAQGVIQEAASIDPSKGATYSADVMITSGGSKTTGRAHARAKVTLPEDFKEREKWFDSTPLFRVTPKA